LTGDRWAWRGHCLSGEWVGSLSCHLPVVPVSEGLPLQRWHGAGMFMRRPCALLRVRVCMCLSTLNHHARRSLADTTSLVARVVTGLPSSVPTRLARIPIDRPSSNFHRFMQPRRREALWSRFPQASPLALVPRLPATGVEECMQECPQGQALGSPYELCYGK
jgi:hypothetical protein